MTTPAKMNWQRQARPSAGWKRGGRRWTRRKKLWSLWQRKRAWTFQPSWRNCPRPTFPAPTSRPARPTAKTPARFDPCGGFALPTWAARMTHAGFKLPCLGRLGQPLKGHRKRGGSIAPKPPLDLSGIPSRRHFPQHTSTARRM